MRPGAVTIAALIAAGAVGGVVGIAGREALGDESPTVTTVEVSAQEPTASVAGVADGLGAVAEIYRRVGRSVVEVRATAGSGLATGSGFVVDEEGRVVTNHHVIDGASSVTVVTAGGTEYDAVIVGSDPSTDIAVLDVEEGAELDPLQLAPAESLAIGDPVIAIGSPFGLTGSVTFGIVSGLDRQIVAPDGYAIDGVIQTDAALNSGNSGGPLLDLEGRVVGVNSQIESQTGGNVGIGYAVPVATAQTVIAQLLEDGTAQHGYLGVQLGDPSGEDGIPVAEVVDGGPADEAGLEAGDRIVEVSGDEVATIADVRTAVSTRQPGEVLTVTVIRDGETRTIRVELGERPSLSS